MKKVDYFLSGIDDEGNQVIDIPLDPSTAAHMILVMAEKGTVQIIANVEAPAPNPEHETTASVQKRAYNKKPKEVAEEKEPRAARKTKYDRDAMVTDIRRGLMKIPEMAKKYNVSEATIYNVAGKEGIVFKRGRKNEPEAAAKPVRTEAMSPEQYAELRSASHDKEFQSGKYSLTQKVPLREVNFGIHSQSYQHYLKIRYDE